MSGNMETLIEPLKQLHAYQEVAECIDRNTFPIHISGCIDGQKSHLAGGLMELMDDQDKTAKAIGQALGKKSKTVTSSGEDTGEQTRAVKTLGEDIGEQPRATSNFGRSVKDPERTKWVVYIADHERRARELLADLRLYDRDAIYYPAKDVIFYSADIHGNAIEVERLKTIKSLLTKRGGTIVTTMSAAMEQVQSLSVYDRFRILLQEGGTVELEELGRKLTDLGYTRQSQVEAPGDFSIRGGILDIFSPTEDCPYRIELWGDEIDTIRSMDVESQRSIERVPEFEIFPAVEIILDGQQIQSGMEKLEKELKKQQARLNKEKNFEAGNRLADTIQELKERLSYTRSGLGLESYLKYFDTRSGSFLDYFPSDDTLFIVDEPQYCMESMKAVEEEFRESMANRLTSGLILPGQMDIIYPASAVEGMLAAKKTIYFSMLDAIPRELTVRESLHIQCQSVGSYNKHFDLLIEDMKHWLQQKNRILLLCNSRTRAKRLAHDLGDYEIPAFYKEEPDVGLQPGQIMVSYGFLSKGFFYPNLHFIVVTESDIFGSRQKRKQKRTRHENGQMIQSFHDLSVGDYVIHENYGLGIYEGIEKIKSDHVEKDYIKIKFGDGGNLYVPVSSLDILQKYADKDAARAPKLNKLNTNEWRKTKTRVRKEVQEIARDLVELYAKRQKDKGFQFSQDTVWQTEFEELFPFEETADQLSAIAATKRDMESPKIMDRLICGDVGYGKTEVALRAAFKAVNDNKQVAFLVPTTILAQQHFATLQERIGDFPVNVALLSRFRTSAQQKETIRKLKKGEVDIVIGTHRLLSADVEFKDLGLLIVDEEQRFGVTHKEKIKKLKGNVDVLTLSATPIPRTLHMSLVGIRDMSVLEEPPVDRLPIQTFVMEHSPEIIREAINRELGRGGQVYYVFNRVRNIEELASQLQALIPDAVVAYAHGQMRERELERIMMRFIAGEIDVLVSTTIIETGLDIANVNTIIIDNADQMGLSQLYQLRGRVGRSNRTAYAFLMYKRNKLLKEVAQKRLEAIREFTALGSGIRVAMRDLEIRGAGNLLGAAQSGHMEAVGYDLYCKMLNEAVAAMKGDKSAEEEFDTSIDLQITALIPATYMKSEFQKLDMYKRIAGIETEEELSDMLDELADRFGDVPEATQRLLRIALLKAKAHKAYITQVIQRSDGLRFYLWDGAKPSVELLPGLLEQYGGDLKYVGREKPYFLYRQRAIEDVMQSAEQVIAAIGTLFGSPEASATTGESKAEA